MGSELEPIDYLVALLPPFVAWALWLLAGADAIARRRGRQRLALSCVIWGALLLVGVASIFLLH